MVTDLLIITPGFPANEGDSTCIPPLQVYLLALRKSRPELRMAVIATQYPYTDRPYHWHGMDVHPCNGRISSWRKPLAWLRAGRAFDRIRKRGPVKAIHSLWLGETALLGMNFARRCGAEHLLTLMGQDARDAKGWWDRLTRKPLTIALTPRHAAAFQAMSGCAADAVVPWGIDRTSIGDPAGGRDIDLLFVGSMIEVKRPSGFIACVGDVQEQRAVKAVMVGDGELRAELERTSMGYNGSSVNFTGQLERREVLSLMQRSRILVHTAAFESQGYVFDEALINGMSIVSTAVGSAIPLDRWRIEDERACSMHDHVIDLLDHPPSTDPLILHPVEVTVNEYLRLHGLL